MIWNFLPAGNALFLHPGLAFNQPFAVYIPQYKGEGPLYGKMPFAGQITGIVYRHNYINIVFP